MTKNYNIHNYFIPSYEEARAICDSNGNLIFYETKHVVDGYNISIFNYRLAGFNNFENPIEGNKDIRANELRGLCYVFNTDGTLFNRFVLIDKFWNLNQTECSMYSNLKDLEIKNVYNKEDGSIASFLMLPNGRVVARSKASFISDQAVAIQRIYNTNSVISTFVDWALSNDIIPIFEYVSPKNRIVLHYSVEDLILLKLRDNKTGKYLDLSDYSDKSVGITIAESYNVKSLEELMLSVPKMDDKEGVVVQFTNGKLIKIKGELYCQLHRLYTEDLNREDALIKLIIEEKVDDVIAQLAEEDVKRTEVDNLTTAINRYIADVSKEINDMLSNYNGSRKDFALTYRKCEYFPLAMNVINGKDLITIIKDKILDDTKRLNLARDWIRRYT